LIVSDSGPLIAFSRISQLNLLRDTVGQLIVPIAVFNELVSQGHGRPGSEEIAAADWINSREAPVLQSNLPLRLHGGEREAIALALSLNAQLLIDERLGRRAAQDLGIPVIGTLAVLVEARRLGIIEQVRPFVNELRTVGYWIDNELMEAFFAAIGEAE
jgi:predicted nucleic acid-binding protein